MRRKAKRVVQNANWIIGILAIAAARIWAAINNGHKIISVSPVNFTLGAALSSLYSYSFYVTELRVGGVITYILL